MKRFYERKFKFESEKGWLNPFLALVIGLFLIAAFSFGFYHNINKKLYEKTNYRLGKSILDTACYLGDELLADDSALSFIETSTALYVFEGTTNLICVDSTIDLENIESGYLVPAVAFEVTGSSSDQTYAPVRVSTISAEETVTRSVSPQSTEVALGNYDMTLWAVPSSEVSVSLFEADEIIPVDSVYLNLQNALYTQDLDGNKSYLDKETATAILSGEMVGLEKGDFRITEDFDGLSEGTIVKYADEDGTLRLGVMNHKEEVLELPDTAALYEIDGENVLVYIDGAMIGIIEESLTAKIVSEEDEETTEVQITPALNLTVSESVIGGASFPVGYSESMQYLLRELYENEATGNLMELDAGFGFFQVANGKEDMLEDKFSVMNWSSKGNNSLSSNSVVTEYHLTLRNTENMLKAYDYQMGKYSSVNATWEFGYRYVFAGQLLLLLGILAVFLVAGLLVSRGVHKQPLQSLVMGAIALLYALTMLVIPPKMMAGDYASNSGFVSAYYQANTEILSEVMENSFGVQPASEQYEELVTVFSQNVYGEDADGYYYDAETSTVMEDSEVKASKIRAQVSIYLVGWFFGVLFGGLILYGFLKGIATREKKVHNDGIVRADRPADSVGPEMLFNTLYNFSTAYIFVLPGIIGMLLLVFIPMIFTLLLSFTSLPKYFTEVNFTRNWIWLQNFSEILFLPDSIKTSVSGNEITVKYHLLDDRNKESFEFSAAEGGKWVTVEYSDSETSGTDEGDLTTSFSDSEPSLDDASYYDSEFWLVYFRLDENGKIIRSTLEKDKAALRGFFSNERTFYYTLLFTIFYTVLSLVLQVTLGVFIAVILHDRDVKLNGMYQVLFMLPWIMPTYISGIIWNYMFTSYGVIDQLANVFSQMAYTKAVASGAAVQAVQTYSSGWMGNTAFGFFMVSFVSAWYAFPFIMLVTLSALQTVPKSVYEAALIDGANWGQTLFKIVIPMIRPTVLPSVLLSSIWTFNNFNLVYLFTGGDDRYDILITRIYDFLNVAPELASRYGWTYGYAAAYSALIFVVLLAYIFLFAKASNLTEKNF